MTPQTVDGLRREVAGLAERGFTAIKVSFSKFLEFGENLKEDMKYVKAIRDTIGYEIELAMSDRAPRRGVPKAIGIARRLEEYDLIFWEDPLPRGDIEAYERLTSAVALPIEAGEEMTNQMLRYFISRRAVDAVNPDVAQHGGLSERKKIADLAHAQGIRDIPHSYCSAVSVAANVHLTASMPDNDLMEYRVSMPDPSINELLLEPLEFKDGLFTVPEGPGLGVELNREILKRIAWDG
jgi:D-galactarolactone cycloisomerase